MPHINPEVIIPVRFEIRGKINGTSSTAFHVIGDFFNFNPTPPFDPQKLQVSGSFLSYTLLHYCLHYETVMIIQIRMESFFTRRRIINSSVTNCYSIFAIY